MKHFCLAATAPSSALATAAPTAAPTGAPTAEAQSVHLIIHNQEQRAQYPAEAAAIEALTGSGFEVARSEDEAVGITLADGFRLLGTGAFDMATIQVGSVATDDPFPEGIDPIGVSTDMQGLKGTVDACRGMFGARHEETFGVTAAAIWPFGRQVFLCDAEMEAALRDVAINTNGTAQACSTGDACPEGGISTAYDMKQVPVTDADKAKVAEISVSRVLPEWSASCEASFPACTQTSNETVGAARGLTIN